MPGTVVDKDIVHPFQYQFFLASHAAIQGVTKPTKYCVLVDENRPEISTDDLQAITYGKFERVFSESILTIVTFAFRFVPLVHTMQPIGVLSSANLLCSSGRCSRKAIHDWCPFGYAKSAERIFAANHQTTHRQQLPDVLRLIQPALIKFYSFFASYFCALFLCM